MISTNEKQKIMQEAKELLNNFGESLNGVKVTGKNALKKSEVRAEGEGETVSSELRRRILDNAPHKNSDYIISEKANWN